MENNQPSYCNKAIEELMRGREFANHLLQLVRHHGSTNGHQASLIPPFAEHLVNKILRSFTNTLLLLNSNYDSLLDISIRDDSSASIPCPKSEGDLEESCKISLSTIRNRRGCYKRKRNIQTLETDSPFLVDDGYAWRKYGQKKTMNATYLRNYYRCSHKYEQGCPAIKQVQRIQEGPPLYRTTYYGLHTCKNQLLPEMTLDPSSPSDSSLLLSFNNTIPSKEDQYPFSSASIRKEAVEEEIPDGQNHSSLCDYLITSDSSRQVTVLSSTLDLVSSVKIESFEVDDVLLRCFEFDEFVHFGL